MCLFERWFSLDVHPGVGTSDPRASYLKALPLPHPSPSFLIYCLSFFPRCAYQSLPNFSGSVWYNLSVDQLSDMCFENSLLQFLVHFFDFS